MVQQRCVKVSVISWHLSMSHTRHQSRKKQTTLVKSHHTKKYTRENIKAKEKVDREEALITLPDAVATVCRNKYDSNVLPTIVNPD